MGWGADLTTPVPSLFVKVSSEDEANEGGQGTVFRVARAEATMLIRLTYPLSSPYPPPPTPTQGLFVSRLQNETRPFSPGPVVKLQAQPATNQPNAPKTSRAFHPLVSSPFFRNYLSLAFFISHFLHWVAARAGSGDNLITDPTGKRTDSL